MSQIEKSKSNTLRRDEDKIQFTSEEVNLIKQSIAPNLNDAEFAYFIKLSKNLGLNPLLNQVWAVKFGNKPAAIFTGRDGFLRIAHESGYFAGMRTRALIKNKNGEIVESDISLDDKSLVGAICYVYRTDWKEPLIQAVRLSDYDKGQSNWNKMKEVMIKKVAESMALRKAFSIYGVYAEEEFDHEKVNKSSTASKNEKQQKIKEAVSKNNVEDNVSTQDIDDSQENSKKQSQPSEEDLAQYARLKKVAVENAKLHKMKLEDVVALIKKTENIDVTNQASYSSKQAEALANQLERANYQKKMSIIMQKEDLDFDKVKHMLEDTFNNLQTLEDVKEAYQELATNTELFK
jgi:phage recombination protein Bet